MKLSVSRSLFAGQIFPIATTTLCVALFTQGEYVAAQAPQAQSAVQQTTTTESDAPKIPNDQLDSLVAPIALYSDPLLAQTIAASTYPLEIVQLEQWLKANKTLKDKALADAVAKQPWDPSVQTLAGTPDLLQRLSGNIAWTMDLGNAYLAQPSDVMDAVQRMRAKAETKGALKTSAQQVVETKTVESGKQVIEIQPAQPDVVYVPSYDPVVVYGPPAYPYYPYSYPGYYPGMGLAWGAAGFALGAWAGGAWGNANWNNGDININRNNNFNRNSNINGGNRNNTNRTGQAGRGQAGQGNKWQHRPEHRGSAPYGDRKTADKFGGNARQQPARGGGNRSSQRPASGASNRPGGGAGAGNRPGGGAGASNRPGGGAGAATRPGGGTGTGPGGGSAGAGARPSTRPAGGSAKNQVGNRSTSSRPSTSGGGGFSGGSGNYARSSSSRGGSSMGGGGYSRSSGSYGGGRGGGSRGGGGGGSRGGGGGRR